MASRRGVFVEVSRSLSVAHCYVGRGPDSAAPPHATETGLVLDGVEALAWPAPAITASATVAPHPDHVYLRVPLQRTATFSHAQ